MKKTNAMSEKYKLIYNDYYTYFKNLCLNRFKWEGLPPLMRQEYIEEYLFDYGRCLFLNDRNYGNIVVQLNAKHKLNVYGEFVEYTGIGANGETFNASIDDSIIIRNNRLMTSMKEFIVIQCHRLAELEISIDINTKHQRTPYLIKTTDNQLLTSKNIYNKIEEGQPAIYLDKATAIDNINVFPTLAPFVADKLTDQRREIFNLIYTRLGLNNSNIDKKERVVVDEVNANNELINESLAILLDSRQKACEEINSMFSLNISCEVKEVTENEPIHNRIQWDSK